MGTSLRWCDVVYAAHSVRQPVPPLKYLRHAELVLILSIIDQPLLTFSPLA
jgi:hypothetical protein